MAGAATALHPDSGPGNQSRDLKMALENRKSADVLAAFGFRGESAIL